MAGFEDYEPGDYSEMREGLAPPKTSGREVAGAEPTAAAGDLHAALKLLASRDLKLKVTVADAYTGEDLWVAYPQGIYRFGERVTLHVDLALVP